MNHLQKISLMLRLIPLANNENQHESKVLFHQVYNSYQQNRISTMLMSVKSEDNHYLPLELVNTIKRFAY